MKKIFKKINSIYGSIIEISNVHNVQYGEIVKIKSTIHEMLGRVVKLEDDKAIVQVFGSSIGIGLNTEDISFEGKPFELSLSSEILGRTFNGLGKPIDKGGDIYSDDFYNINGRPMNPVSRKYPRNFIQTGISSIDTMITLIRGQKLPIFSGSGLPHNQIAAQIVSQAKLLNTRGTSDDFAIIFCAMGVKRDEAYFFKDAFKNAGVEEHVVMYLNYADDPIMERIITPKCAMTAAEYLAFEKNMHILVIMTDMTSYGEALREISSLREEVPSRKGYPGYLYSDLASLYERAGMLRDLEGSITLIPILSMPSDDITHPIPDLTGYITEGQIVLSRDLFQKGIYPPINVLPSLSRLMKDGIGEGYTRNDHPDLSSQLFSAYSKGLEIRALAQIIGEDDISAYDKQYLNFTDKFETLFIQQEKDEDRPLEESLAIGWNLLKLLPIDGLDRIDPKFIKEYLQG